MWLWLWTVVVGGGNCGGETKVSGIHIRLITIIQCIAHVFSIVGRMYTISIHIQYTSFLSVVILHCGFVKVLWCRMAHLLHLCADGV